MPLGVEVGVPAGGGGAEVATKAEAGPYDEAQVKCDLEAVLQASPVTLFSWTT